MKTKRFLVLTGSGEFTKAMETTDKHLLTLARDNSNLTYRDKLKVAIIPTAAGEEHDYYKWVVMGINHFTRLGAIASGFDIISKKDANNRKYSERIESCHVIYFSGGNPGFLLKNLKKSLFWKSVYGMYKKGAILAGSSAGAMIMGKHVLGNIQMALGDDEKPIWKKSFGLISFSIIPHYDYIFRKEKIKFKKLMDSTPKKIKNNFIGIDEDTALIIENENSAIVMGVGNILIKRKNTEKIYKSRSKFSLRQSSVV